jgi:hypothetical protein
VWVNLLSTFCAQHRCAGHTNVLDAQHEGLQR